MYVPQVGDADGGPFIFVSAELDFISAVTLARRETCACEAMRVKVAAACAPAAAEPGWLAGVQLIPCPERPTLLLPSGTAAQWRFLCHWSAYAKISFAASRSK
eukprot:scaffold4538_cov410-Prasinococcus_capsulatus_cf.AAC.3